MTGTVFALVYEFLRAKISWMVSMSEEALYPRTRVEYLQTIKLRKILSALRFLWASGLVFRKNCLGMCHAIRELMDWAGEGQLSLKR